MELRLDENYFLESDSNQWTLNYRKSKGINPETKKETFSNDKWYCSSLENALKRYTDESAKESETVDELSSKLDLIFQTINSIEWSRSN